ncbi:MAG: helix-turn-helix transcriptional regulator [Candidatus Riflebacteria bacterium]|nr:helix-turn-helix transcriptional regulator [Candidatus Riflebacteria bacterium]
MEQRADILVRFGRRVASLRKSQRLTQEILASLSGLDRSYVSGIERGQRNVSLKNIQALAQALDTTLDKLFEGV